MPVIQSQLDPHSAQFAQNHQAMLAGLQQLRDIQQHQLDKAAEAKAKFEKRGQLLPRERLNLLLDPGAPFLELAGLAGYKLHDDKDGSQAGGGLIAGIGYVCGVRVLVAANNSAIKGGTISPSGLYKSLRLQQIAMENKLPVVTLAESGGANLNYAAEIFIEGARSFANQARMSAMGLPQITVVHGSATAGGAYQPGLSDYVVVVRGKAKLFLAGPPLLKAATGEVATDEQLGGAEMHAQVAGTAEYLAENDADGIRIVREIVSLLPWNAQLPTQPPRTWSEPLYPIEELLGLVPDDPKKPYDAREIVARLADGSQFLEFKGEFDAQTLCGHLQIRAGPAVSSATTARSPPGREQGRAVHPALRPEPDTAAVLPQHHRFHGRHRIRAARGDQARLEADPGGGQRPGTEADHRGRRLLRRRQLCDVRPRPGPAFHLRLAQ